MKSSKLIVSLAILLIPAYKLFHVKTNYIQPKIFNEIICNGCLLTFDFFKSAIGNMETRISLFDSGKEIAKTFLGAHTL